MNRKNRIAAPLVAVGILFVATGLTATTEQERGGELPWMGRVSYAIGHDLATQALEGLRLDKVDADKAMLIRGFTDAIMEREGLLTKVEVEGVLRRFHEQISLAEVEDLLEKDPVFKAMHDDNHAKSQDVMRRFSQQEGAKKLDNGVMYIVERAANGQMPSANDTVFVNFRGMLRDGSEFASGYNAEIPVATMLEGPQSVITKMKVGEKWVVAIPPALGFGAAGRPPLVGPNEALLIEVELLSVKSD